MLNLKRWIIEIVILSLVFAGVGYAAHEQYFPLGVKSDGDVIVGKTLKTFQGSDVASANDMTLGDGNFFDITGTTTINTIATKGIGTFVVLEFDGILQLTHSGDLFLPTAANITTAAGDIAVFYEYAAVDWRCASYTRADGTTLAASAVAWDDIGNPDANKSIDFTDYYTDFDFGDTDHDMFTIWATGAFGDYSVVKIEQKTGDPTDGDLLHLKTADAEANVDNLIMSNGDDDYVTHKIVEAGTYTIDITSDGTALLAIVDPTTISAVFTVSPDGTNEVFQVNDGSVDFTDGNAGTTGVLTVDSSGHWSYNKNIVSTGNVAGATYGSDGTVTNAELLYINSLGSNAQTQIDALVDGWTTTTGTFTATPASTSTITMTSDLTGSILVGMSLRYTIGAVVYYGRVAAIANNLLTVNGAPLGGDVTALAYNGGDVRQIVIVIPDNYEDASNTDLIGSDLKSKLLWQLPKSYLVYFSVYSNVEDTSDDGQASVQINNTETNTTAGGETIAAAQTWYPTVVNIASAAYDINMGEELEVTCIKGTTGDATDLTVIMVFVTP